jgi:hypothetical protein
VSAAGEAILKLLLIGEDKSASAALGKVAAKAKLTGDESKKHLGGIGAAMGALGGIAAAAGVVKFGSDAINSFKDVGTESIKLSRLTGLPIEAASRLRFALSETGVDAEAAGKGLGIFEKNLVSGTAQKALSGLGLSVKDSTGHLKSMQDLLPGVADKFKSMPDGPEKTALAMQLFGKSGATMIPFLNRGADGIKALNDESDKYGLTISGPMADQIKKAKESQKDWDASVQGLSVQFGAVLLPVLTNVLGYVRDQVIPIIASASGFFGRHADTIGHVIAVVGPIVGIIAGVVAAIRVWTVVQGLLNVVMALNPVGLVIIAIAALAAGLIYAYQHSETFRNVVDTAFHAIATVATWLWNNALQPMIKFFVEGTAQMIWWVGGLLEALSQVPGFEWAKDAATKIKGAADEVYKFSKSIEKIPETANVQINVTANYSATAAAALSVARGNLKLSGKGFASGGRPPMGMYSTVGENGPELFKPDTPGTVIPFDQIGSVSRAGGGASGNGGGGDTIYITVQGDTDPDAAARSIEAKLWNLRKNRGNGPLRFMGA